MISPGLFKRLIVMIYDGFLLAAVILLFSVPLPFIPDEWSTTFLGKSLKQIYLVAVTYIFFAGFWCNGGQTLGMKAWHLRLVDVNGNPVGVRAATTRYVSAILSWAIAGLGYLWILIDRDNLAWHDRLSETRIVVLKKKKAQRKPN